MKSIQIIIDSNGQSRLQTLGFAGTECRQASKALEQALGLIESDRPTAEMLQWSGVQQAEQQKLGH